jgi:branched-chain amino acid transport system ATP-binding protein
MMKLLGELKARYSLFVIEHTMRVIRELADRVVVLVSGQKIADGRPDEILRDERVVRNYLGSQGA